MTAVRTIPKGRGRNDPRLFEFDPVLAHFRLSAVKCADLLGVARRQVQRWKNVGLTMAQADTIAIILGAMPDDLWDQWGTFDQDEAG